ncbi:ROK family protein [Deinococcus sp.]|uniref:ROK family protein n=1 Tax=Deinococcus sp. TaxID=47478 RepID=UPI003CC640BE
MRAAAGPIVPSALLGDGLANLLTAFRSEVIVIGGGSAVSLPHCQTALLDTLATVKGCFPPFQLLPGALGDQGGAMGAAALAWKVASP